MHTVLPAAIGGGTAGATAAADARRRSPAPPAIPARNCCASSRGIRRSRSPPPCRRAPPAGRARRFLRSPALWDGDIEPLVARDAAREADIVFLALPDKAAAELAPALVDAGVRVIDLSGAFRLRDKAQRARWYPETHAHSRRARLRPDRARARRGGAGAARREPGLLSDGGPAGAGAARQGGSPRARRRRHRRREVRRVRRRQDADRAHALLRSATAACPPTACSATGTGRKSNRGSAARSRSRRTSCRSTAAFSTTIYVRVAARHDRGAARRRVQRAPTATTPFVRLTGAALPEIKHVAHTNFCDIGWRVHPSGRVDARLGHRQPAQGRLGAGRPEHERDARHRRSGRACCDRRLRLVSEFGGELLEDPARLADVVVGRRAHRGAAGSAGSSIVHGGGKEIDAALKAAGIAKRQVDGLRITDDATLDVVVAVLAGTVNTRFVAALTTAGVRGRRADGRRRPLRAVGSAPPHRAVDGRLVDLGRVGVPSDRTGYAPADDARRRRVCAGRSRASASATMAGCSTSTPTRWPAISPRGLARAAACHRGHDAPACSTRPARPMPLLEPSAIERLISGRTATAGMIAKLRACEHALANGVGDVVIVDGRDRAALEAAALGGTPPATRDRADRRRRPEAPGWNSEMRQLH